MTTPSVMAYRANVNSAKYREEFGLLDKKTYEVPAATAADTIIGMIPFKKGMHMFPNSLNIVWADLDDVGACTIDVGWAYVTGSSATDDPNGFIDGLDATSAGGSATLAATGIAFVGLENGAEDDGWITIAIRDAATSKAGDVTVSVGVAYGIPPTTL